jgi:hypothetical protein
MFLTLGLLGAAGCATPDRVAMLPGVGPSPSQSQPTVWAAEGYLQVYSARERIPTNPNGSEFAWNNDFGNNDFLFGDARTSYALYSADGQLVQQVRNASGRNASPALVSLTPGSYQIRAEAVDFNDVTSTVMVPVCIESGQTTQVHLDGKWSPQSKGHGEGQWVRLSNGSIVGWHCSGSEGLTAALQ